MQKQIAKNKRNTFVIIAGFIIIISLFGFAFSQVFNNWPIFYSTVIFALLYSLFQYFLATKLSVLMTGAKEVDKNTNPRLYHIVQKLAIEANLPMPKVYIVADPAPNAFASGRSPEKSLVAATTGLLDIMDDRELTAVMAHELSHIRNYDIRVSMITFGLVSIIGFISDLGVRMLFFGGRDEEDRSPVGFFMLILFSLIAPIAASLAQLAVSREREYLADASATNLLKNPEDMALALKKLDAHSRPMRRQNPATEALYINNPMRKGIISGLFSTHPPIEKRIERLENAKKNR